jgi:hypothetical protein
MHGKLSRLGSSGELFIDERVGEFRNAAAAFADGEE